MKTKPMNEQTPETSERATYLRIRARMFAAGQFMNDPCRYCGHDRFFLCNQCAELYAPEIVAECQKPGPIDFARQKPESPKRMNNPKVIAVTGDWPAGMLNPDGKPNPDFDLTKLDEHGAIFDDDSFVSYAEMNWEQIEALHDAQLEAAGVAVRRFNAFVLLLSPEQRVALMARLTPEQREQVRRIDGRLRAL